MRLFLRALIVLLCLTCPAAAQAPADGTGQGADSPGSEFIRVPSLEGFESSSAVRHKTGFRRVYRRPGDTAARWSEMVIIGTNSDWKDRAPLDIAKGIVGTHSAACAKLDVRGLEQKTEGDYPIVIMSLTCRDPKPDAKWFGLADLRPLEFTAIKLIQGRNSFYMVQRFWHGDTEVEPVPLADPQVRRQWLAFTQQTRLCDRTRPDPACGTGQQAAAGGEALHFNRPPGFDPGAPRGQGNMRILELVPKGESLDNWTEILTFTTEAGTRNRDIRRYVEFLIELQRKQCRSVEPTLTEVRREKGYAMIDFETICRDPRPQPGGTVVLRRLEFLRGRVIQGMDNFHTVQRAWHSDTAKEPAPLTDSALRRNWDDFFDGIDVCDRRVAGQACKGAIPVFQVSGSISRETPGGR